MEQEIKINYIYNIKCSINTKINYDQILPANRKTKPREPFAGFAIEKMPNATSTIPIINSVTAANTVRQFSRIFG